MAKKNKKTFSQRAKAIQAKYKGSENDQMAIEAMEMELQRLMQEQEAYKTENGLDNESVSQSEYKNGGALVDYNTTFPYKDTSGQDFYVTRRTTETMNNPNFKPFNEGYSYFTDPDLVPDFGNISLVKHNKETDKVSFVADQTGDTAKSMAAARGDLDLNTLNKPKLKNGGGLKKYAYGDPLEDYDFVNPDDIETVESLSVNPQGYSPSYNWLSPTISTATNIAANLIGGQSRQKQKEKLLSQQDNLHLGRISPQKIDLGRQRSSILQNRDLVTAAGRRKAGSSTSLAEAANIERASRLGASRVAGEQLGKSYTQEEITNMKNRQRAEEYNAQMKAKEAMIGNQNKMMIERQYGDPSKDWIPQTIKSTGQSYTNALAEQRKQEEYYDYLNMLSRNYYLDKNKQLTNR
jgi:hypothetical protein